MDEGTKAVYVLHAQILKTLANPRRLMIMDTLHAQPLSVGEIEAAVGLPQPTVSQHLSALRSQGLVVPRREGNTTYYALVSDEVAEACELFREFLLKRIRASQSVADQFPLRRPFPNPGAP
jgi:ArsR family transcriptional regulator